jgi:hypothetical protein
MRRAGRSQGLLFFGRNNRPSDQEKAPAETGAQVNERIQPPEAIRRLDDLSLCRNRSPILPPFGERLNEAVAQENG